MMARMPEHRIVSIALFALFVLIVAIDYWRKANLLKRAGTSPAGPVPAVPATAAGPASPSEAPPPGPSPGA